MNVRRGRKIGYATLACLGPMIVAVGMAQEYRLSDAELRKLSLSLPDSMKTVQELSAYQRKMSVHQTISLKWQAPDGREVIDRAEAEAKGPAVGDVTVVRKVENQQGSPGRIKMEIATDDVVVIGIAATDEVRCIAVMGDPRLFHSEWFGPVPDRKDFLKTVTEFDLPFCQDPSITKARMFRWNWKFAGPGTSLVEVGSFALAPRSLPTKHQLSDK
jgi:hypothetical protein